MCTIWKLLANKNKRVSDELGRPHFCCCPLAQQHHFHPTLMGQKFQPVHLRRSYLAVFYPRLVRYPLISAKTYHSLHTLSTVRAPSIEVKREPFFVQHPSFICETCGSLKFSIDYKPGEHAWNFLSRKIMVSVGNYMKSHEWTQMYVQSSNVQLHMDMYR